MNRAIDAYLGELEALRFSHSRRHHATRTLERLLIYMREAHSITDWRAVNESQLRDFALYVATYHRSPRGKPISAARLRQWLSIIVLSLAEPHGPPVAQSGRASGLSSQKALIALRAQ